MGNKWSRGTSRESRGVKGGACGVPWTGQDRGRHGGPMESTGASRGAMGVKGNIMDQMGSLGVVRGSQVIKREV